MLIRQHAAARHQQTQNPESPNLHEKNIYEHLYLNCVIVLLCLILILRERQIILHFT